MSRDDELLPDAEPVSEESARKVLERAIQIDAERAGDTTVGELRKIAQELNISPTALMQALREVHVVAPEQLETPDAGPGKLSRFNRALGWARTVGVTFGGMFIGLMAHRDRDGPFVVALLIAMAGAAALTAFDRHRKSEQSTLRDVAMLFVGTVFGWGRQNAPAVNDEQIWFLLIGGAVSLAATWLLQRVEWPASRNVPKSEFTATA